MVAKVGWPATQMQIRITITPPGEAPENVRKAWVGLVLPSLGCSIVPMVGVLSGPKGIIDSIVALFRGQISLERGYIVNASHAIEILGQNAPDAAAWWRENAARTVAPGKYFVFSKAACERI